jgi:nucleoside-diphosphate-sugar epimerase
MKEYYDLSKNEIKLIKNLKGPIVVFGAGGFIGVNILQVLLKYRSDVYGISQDVNNNWRFKTAKIPKKNLRNCDLNNGKQVHSLIKKIRPKTIFNLAAYGSYAKQREIKKIYDTNVSATVNLLEILKEYGFEAYIHAGSQSEYGINSKAPIENSELIPNSHYSISKISNYYTIKYYGKIENLPVVHLRIYSAYGPWEEPDRLIPTILANGRKGVFPDLVDPDITRDFIYINDVVRAFIYSASKINKKIYGEVFNVATGKKTSIKKLVEEVGNIFNIKDKPKFGTMKNRDWDLKDWYGNIKKIEKVIGWKPKILLVDGLSYTIKWQVEVDLDKISWNKKVKKIV